MKKYDLLGVAAALMFFAVAAASFYSYFTEGKHHGYHLRRDYDPAPPALDHG